MKITPAVSALAQALGESVAELEHAARTGYGAAAIRPVLARRRRALSRLKAELGPGTAIALLFGPPGARRFGGLEASEGRLVRCYEAAIRELDGMPADVRLLSDQKAEAVEGLLSLAGARLHRGIPRPVRNRAGNDGRDGGSNEGRTGIGPG